MSAFRQAGLLLLASALAGCEPKERAEWSPDGTRAAVLAKQRVYFTDQQGGLSEALPDRDEEPGRLLIEAFDWLADSSGLVVHRLRLTPAWEELAPLLPPAEAARVEALAAQAPGLLRAAVAIHGDADRAGQLLDRLAPGESFALGNALRLARTRDAAAVSAALADAPRALANFEEERKSDLGFLLHEIAVLRPGSGKPAEVISRGLRAVRSLRVSPQHEAVAAAFETGGENRYDLHVLPLGAGAPLVVAKGISRAYDWTPDGASLVFMSSLSEGGGGLVGIERRRVLDEAGRVGEGLPGDKGDEKLAYAVVSSPRLAVLADGDILFASHAAPLPAAAAGLAEKPRLYRLPAKGGEPLVVPTEEGALPMDLGYFVPSPDGRRLLVVESGTDTVALLDLESGRNDWVSEPHPRWKTRAMPSWRNAEEFTYAAVDPPSKRVSWRLWKDGETVDLSAGWPDQTTSEYLEFK